MVTLPVQVNGKVRANVEVPAQIDEAALRELVFANEGVRRYVPDPAKIRRFVLVPGRIVNIVV
jgi:leucyl-tRNA synthetase